jgi:hypothetical protein
MSRISLPMAPGRQGRECLPSLGREALTPGLWHQAIAVLEAKFAYELEPPHS